MFPSSRYSHKVISSQEYDFSTNCIWTFFIIIRIRIINQIENFFYFFLLFSKMNIIQLPEDILIKIIDEMNDNIFPVSIVNKEIYTLSNDRLRREREKIERRVAFFERFYAKHS